MKRKEAKTKPLIETAVIYKAVRCPNPDCKGTRVPVQRTGPSPPGHIIRHHKCEDCGRKFKSVEADKQLAGAKNKDGSRALLIKTIGGGVTENPLLYTRKRAWDQVFKAAACFGLTPADLAGVRAVERPAGGIVLDPFGGSGTTALACINTGRKYLLIEKEPHYCEIARARVNEKS